MNTPNQLTPQPPQPPQPNTPTQDIAELKKTVQSLEDTRRYILIAGGILTTVFGITGGKTWTNLTRAQDDVNTLSKQIKLQDTEIEQQVTRGKSKLDNFANQKIQKINSATPLKNFTELDKRIKALENSKTNFSNISGLNSRIKALEKKESNSLDLSGIASRITKLENKSANSLNLSEVESRITNLENKGTNSPDLSRIDLRIIKLENNSKLTSITSIKTIIATQLQNWVSFSNLVSRVDTLEKSKPSGLEDLKKRIDILESWKKSGLIRYSKGNMKSWSQTNPPATNICGEYFIMVGLDPNHNNEVACATLEMY
jgi:hypothetical protein